MCICQCHGQIDIMLGAATGKLRPSQMAEKTPEDLAALAAFNAITEAASALMDSGELDVYSTCREEFQRAAALFAPAADIFADADGGDDDMFGDGFAAKQVQSLSCFAFESIDSWGLHSGQTHIVPWYCIIAKRIG